MRCYIPPPVNSVIAFQIHTFFDASKMAFAAVTYLRVEHDLGVTVQIIASKSRIAPIKIVTIPRLELLAGLLGANLWINVNENLDDFEGKNEGSYFWGDAKVALFWINNGDQDRYRQNRVIRIRELTDNLPWYHVPGDDNPADLPTRGIFPRELVNNTFWTSGPNWLKESPESPIKIEEPQEELRVACRNVESSLHARSEQTTSLDKIIDDMRYSSTRKLFRVTAYVKRYVSNLRNREPVIGILSSEEVQNAELDWIRILQHRMISENNYEKTEANLRIFRDGKNFLRSKGRIDNAEFPLEVKEPMVLPNKEHLTRLYVREDHDAVYHNGINETMAHLRKRFWIPALRQIARKIIYKCVVCKRLEGKPYRSRPLPPLPDFRVRPSDPFSHCAIDFAGPIYVRKNNYRRSPSIKAYIALITCAATRALHLEFTPDLTSQALIRCLRRFIARRSCPIYIFSDNAKTFEATDLKSFLRDRGITWHFNIPKAPWQNGIVERLVQSTKRCLKKRLGRARLTYEEVDTVIREIECTINNRPLSYIDNDSIEMAVTPNHLSHGRRIDLENTSLFEPIEQELSTQSITKRVLYRDHLVKHFLQRWQKEYLLSLRNAKSKEAKEGNPIKIGDVVHVKDDGSRVFWRLAIVKSLRFSRDGEVRGATLRVANRDLKATELVRPIELIYPLELECETKYSTIPVCEENIELFEDDGSGVTDDESTLSDTESNTE